MKQVYVLEAIIQDKNKDKIIVDIVGIYINAEDALKYKILCEKDLSKEEEEVISFNMRNVYINQPPAFLDPDKWIWQREDLKNIIVDKTNNLNLDVFDDTMIEMMKDGLVDQLIGSDGEFYYHLTEKGKQYGYKQDIEPEEDNDNEDDDWLNFKGMTGFD